ENVLEIERLFHGRGELDRELRRACRWLKEILGEDRIEDDRVAAQMLREVRRAPQDLRYEVQQPRVRVKEREQLHAGGQAREKPIEPAEAFVGPGRASQGAEDGGHQLGQKLSRTNAAGCPITPVMPAAH